MPKPFLPYLLSHLSYTCGRNSQGGEAAWLSGVQQVYGFWCKSSQDQSIPGGIVIRWREQLPPAFRGEIILWRSRFSATLLTSDLSSLRNGLFCMDWQQDYLLHRWQHPPRCVGTKVRKTAEPERMGCWWEYTRLHPGEGGVLLLKELSKQTSCWVREM